MGPSYAIECFVCLFCSEAAADRQPELHDGPVSGEFCRAGRLGCPDQSVLRLLHLVSASGLQVSRMYYIAPLFIVYPCISVLFTVHMLMGSLTDFEFILLCLLQNLSDAVSCVPFRELQF